MIQPDRGAPTIDASGMAMKNNPITLARLVDGNQ